MDVSVNTILPHSVMDTFEGKLLSRLLDSSASDEGIYFYADTDPRTDIVFGDPAELKQFAALCSGSGSEVAEKVRPLLEEANRNGVCSIDLSDPENDISVDYIDVLHAIAKLHPETGPIEVQYSIATFRVKPGEIGGGAFFITPEAIEQIDSHGWLTERRNAYESGRSSAPCM